MIVGVINPTVRDALEVFQPVLRVRPKTALQSVGRPAPVAHFTNVIAIAVVEAEDRMLASMARFFQSDACHAASGGLGIKDENVTPLFLLVAFLIYYYGEPIKIFIEKYFNILTIFFVVLLVGVIWAIKFVGY